MYTMATIIALAQEFDLGFRTIILTLMSLGSPLSEPVTELAQVLGLVDPSSGSTDTVSAALFKKLLAEASDVLSHLAPNVPPDLALLGDLGMDFIPLSYGLEVMGADLGIFTQDCYDPDYRDCEMDPRSKDPYCIPMSNRARSYMIVAGIHSAAEYQLRKKLGVIDDFPADVKAELNQVLAHWEEAA